MIKVLYPPIIEIMGVNTDKLGHVEGKEQNVKLTETQVY